MLPTAPTWRRKITRAVAGLALPALCLALWAFSRAPAKSAAPRLTLAPMASARAAEPRAVESSSAVAVDARVALGRKMFFDARLSEPEGMSCATCHDPARGFASGNTSELGVAHGRRPGRMAGRNTPSVLYLSFVRRFHLEWEEEAELPEAFGGFFWDGRASSIASLVEQPLLNPNEMGNPTKARIAEKIRKSKYAAELSAEFDDVFASPERTVEALGFCLEAFLVSPEMSPFSSKYDEHLRGHAALSSLEARGLALFDDPDKGACSSCHKLDAHSSLPEASLFTDYGYDTVAVPRNRRLPANRDPQRFDLGVCERRDPKLHTEDAWFCGAFRTPSLRNVAQRTSFMHNGAFSNLREVVSFYATRSSDPKRWYPARNFDDLPKKYQQYVNRNAAPYNHPEGSAPALNDEEIDAIVAFLGTLSDAPLQTGDATSPSP